MPRSFHSDAYASVVARLIELRKAGGVTQVELARRLGKTQQFISYIERGERRIDVVEFVVILRALDREPGTVLNELARGWARDIEI